MKKSLLYLTLVFGISIIKAQKWEPFVKMDNNIFPSYIIATANQNKSTNYRIPSSFEFIGNPNNIIGIKLSNIPYSSKIRIEITENEFIKKTAIEENLTDLTKTYYLFPQVNYKYEKLRNLTQQTPLNIEFRLFINNNLVETKLVTCSVRTLEECPYYIKDEISNTFIQTPWMFSAYVNEDSPIINEILSKALKSNIVNHFNGYQGDIDHVKKQVFAIWYTLQENGIKYSSITDTSLQSNSLFSQRVRMVDQSYKFAQANCVDGTILFASVLKAIGLNPVLVLIPGHMFLGYYLDKNNTQINFLETTMIGEISLDNLKSSDISTNTFKNIALIDQKINETSKFHIGRTLSEKQQQLEELKNLRHRLLNEAKKEASVILFNKAVNTGINKFKSLKTKFGKDPRYQMINLHDARKLVTPIWR